MKTQLDLAGLADHFPAPSPVTGGFGWCEMPSGRANVVYFRRRRGQGLVEFALALPVLLFAIFMFIDLSRAAYYYLVLTNAVREGARIGVADCKTNSDGNVVLQSPAEVEQAVIDRSYGVSPAPSVSQVNLELNTITREFESISRSDHILSVSLSYTYQPVTPFLNDFLGSDAIQIRVSASMQVE